MDIDVIQKVYRRYARGYDLYFSGRCRSAAITRSRQQRVFPRWWPPTKAMCSGWRAGMMILLAAVLTSNPCDAAELSMADMPELETSVCGFLREPFAFWSFRSAAGAPDARRVAGIRDIEPIRLTTRDGRQLGGYKLRAPGNPRGYLLVAQGNAMLADQIMGEFQIFRDRGFDVYVYDYRGYGLSEGRSRLIAIVSDYRDMVAHLNTQNYRRHVLYGLSMGGVILLNAVGTNGSFHALVVDSSPSRISHLGCPESYDPVNNLPADCSRIKIISGERDRIIHPAEMEELLEAAGSRGAQIARRQGFAHPFQDATPEIQRRRFKEVAEFLAR